MKSPFLQRECCPACRSWTTKILCSLALSEPPIHAYLESFYSLQGGIEFHWLEGGQYTLCECQDCGLVYQKEVPDDALLRRLYEKWIDPTRARDLWEKTHGVQYCLKMARDIANVISYLGAAPSSMRFLDFGMGWGHWCMLAKGFGCQVFGTELSDSRVQQALASGIQVLDWDGLLAHDFDFINVEQVLEHVPDPLEILIRLTRALKPGRLIRISVPNGWDIKRRLAVWDWTAPKGHSDSLNPVAPLEHLNCFNHDALVRLAKRVGLLRVHIPHKFSISPVDCFKNGIKLLYERFSPRKGTALTFRLPT